MSNSTSAGNVTLAVSSGAGVIAAINEYAIIISLSLTLLGILVGIFFHVLALKDRRRQMKLDRDSLRDEVIREIAESHKNKTQ